MVRHVASVVHHTCQENAQPGAENVTSVEIKTISVHVVGQSRRAPGTAARSLPAVGAHPEAGKVRANLPGQAQGVYHP